MMRAVFAENGAPIVRDVSMPSFNDTKDGIGHRQVMIRIIATALNRADLMQAAGKYPPPPGASHILGLECAGVIEKVGSGCELPISKLGNTVSALLSGGGFAEFVIVDERHLIECPKHFSFEDAAAVPEVWITAFQLITMVAKVKASDSVLIHAGASSVGIAAIQLLKTVVGVKKIYVTTGSQEKIDFCLSLGASAAFNYKIENWETSVFEKTSNDGVDVVLDCIGTPYAEKNIRVLAPDGRWVLYGLMGGSVENAIPTGQLLGSVLRKRIQLLGTTLRARSLQYKADLISGFRDATFKLFENGQLKPIHDHMSFNGLESIDEAMKYMHSNASKGKIVIRVVT